MGPSRHATKQHATERKYPSLHIINQLIHRIGTYKQAPSNLSLCRNG